MTPPPTRQNRWGRRHAIVLLLLAATQLGCAAMMRHKPQSRVVPQASAAVSQLQKQMNPWLLTDLLAEKLIVEVDWVEGAEPAPMALEALEKTLRKYGPPGRPFEIILSDEIPRSEWEELRDDDANITTLIERFLDTDPHPSPEHTLAYVLYLPYYKRAKDRFFGQQTNWLIERDGLPAKVDGLMMFRESISKRRVLWITGNRIDRATLVHEFGHLFGLVADPEHSVAKAPGHCTEVYCTMTVPSMRAYLANFIPGFFAARIPTDYCKKCRADMAETQAYWAAQAEERPNYVNHLDRRYHDQLAGMLYRQWWYDKEGPARTRLETAAAAYPSRGAYPSTLGHIAAIEGDRNLARTWSMKAGDRANGVDRLNAARTLCAIGDYAAALKMLPTVEEFRTESDDKYVRINHIHVRRWALEGLGRLDEALKELERHHPERTDARIKLLSELGRWDEAQALIEAGPDSMDRLLLLGRLARIRGDDLVAEFNFRIALNSNLQRLDSIADEETSANQIRRGIALESLAEIHAQLGDASAAREALEQLAEVFRISNATIASNTRARVLTIMGDYEGALDALSELELPGRAEADPCVVHGRTALADNPRFKERYPWCAEASATR